MFKPLTVIALAATALSTNASAQVSCPAGMEQATFSLVVSLFPTIVGFTPGNPPLPLFGCPLLEQSGIETIHPGL